ncbi:MAG: DUF2065 domain-containing protein [Alphaproteobacteria bacterium]|nr:DUF2065 domain-containing protein [Alphaproteobacteria bacterium]
MQDILLALGLVLVIEGLLYALVPGHLRQMMEVIRRMSDDQLRIAGAGALAAGVLIVWLVRSFAG